MSGDGVWDAFAPKAEEGEESNAWQCKVCETKDVACLERGADSAMVCGRCGTVAEEVNMIGQERAKNCPKGEDPTQVADVPTQTADQAAFAAWSGELETPEARRRREQAFVGGTRMATKTLRQRNMLVGQNQIDSQAVRDSREMVRDDAPDRGRGKLILVALAKHVFKRLSGMHDHLRKHIRLEAIRIYQASMRHEGCCRKSGCMFAFSHRAVIGLVYGITEHVLAELASDDPPRVSVSPPSPVTTIAEITSGASTKQDAKKLLEEIHQLQERGGGAVPRMQVLSAVSLISKWQNGVELCECDAEWGRMPPALLLPPSVVNCPDEYGKSTTADPADKALIKMRTCLVAAAECSFTRGDLKVAIMHQLGVSTVMVFLSESGLPLEVIGVAVVAATAKAMGKENPTLDVRKHTFRINKVAASTVDAFIDKLVPLIALPVAVEEESLIFG